MSTKKMSHDQLVALQEEIDKNRVIQQNAAQKEWKKITQENAQLSAKKSEIAGSVKRA